MWVRPWAKLSPLFHVVLKFWANVVPQGARSWPTEYVRDMRGMRGKSESPVELAYYAVAAGRGSMDDSRMRPTNGLQGHEVIGGHTCIYADFDSFLAPGKCFFSRWYSTGVREKARGQKRCVRHADF